MYQVIKRFAENDNKNGLMLIDMPTGSGKTYNAISYIFDSCIDPKNKDKKYIFVTTLKKNLPIKDLEKRFKEKGIYDQFQKKVLMIDSNIESVIAGWSDDVEKMIPQEIKRLDEYKAFKSDLIFVKRQREEKNYRLKDYLPSIESNLREKSEPKFRGKVAELLGKEQSTVEKRIYAIKTDLKWGWVSSLYPAVFTRDRQVLFMSMDKFLARNTTIVEPSYMFYNSDLLNNAVVFIDEFDATKETMLKNIISNGLRDKVDYVELFKDIYAALQTDEFPSILTKPSIARQKGDYRDQTLESVIEGIKEKADYIYNSYSLQFKHRTIGEGEESYHNYLFQDHQFHAILNADNSYITMSCDKSQKINAIQFSKQKPELEKQNIQSMLGQLRGFVRFFQGAINILAINYRQNKEEQRKDGDDSFSQESAIRSVLALFRLSEESVDYLTSQIMMSNRKKRGDIERNEFDLSFYENGFRYYAFENDVMHDMQSKIMMFSFQNTPEKILVRFCERAKVIGISATATIPTVIGNYDIEYLKSKMNKVFEYVKSDEKQRLKEQFKSDMKGYEDVNLKVEMVGGDQYSIKSWNDIFDDEELAKYAFDKVRIQFSDGDDKTNYLKERYRKISYVFKQFATHDDIQSFLCVLNKHPRKGDASLDRDVLGDLFNKIADYYGWTSFSLNKNVIYLDGNEYEDNKTDLISRLGRGEKVFVISVYQTIGAGQNLQYPIPDSLKDGIVRINGRQIGEEKDFDAIYLDKPTNLVVQLTDNIEEDAFVKYIFQMEFLQENAEISVSEAMINIKKAFRTYMNGRKTADSFANIYNRRSVVVLGTRYIIQAIGRMCRTNCKNKDIYIFADKGISDSIDATIADDRDFNPEFHALLKKIRESSYKAPDRISLENKASLKSMRVNKEILNMLNNDWSTSKIGRWRELRSLVLKKPTASSSEAKDNFIIKNFYAELPTQGNVVFFTQEQDYNNVSVSFTRDNLHCQIVSAEGAKLPDFLRIPGVLDYFNSNGWATSFADNDYVMTPPLWNNIYKGALGEVVGKYLFERYLEVEMQEIDSTDLFELFDYKIMNSSIFVDFKNWHEGKTADKGNMLQHIASKALICGCKCVIVANIFAEKKWDISDVMYGKTRIISIPGLVAETDGKLHLITDTWTTLQRCFNEYRD